MVSERLCDKGELNFEGSAMDQTIKRLLETKSLKIQEVFLDLRNSTKDTLRL